MSTSSYIELHCHSNYSFREGASSLEELLMRADTLDYGALALTDHDNLCGALEFSRIANSIGIQPITGAEITLNDKSHVTMLAMNRKGYSNLCNLITYSRISENGNRCAPQLEPKLIPKYAEGIILLTGCSKGKVPSYISENRIIDAEAILKQYIEWFGSDSVFIELQQNLVHGDTLRNKRLATLAREVGVGIVATNNVHYHVRERHRLQDALVAIHHNKTLEETHRERRPNTNFFMKSANQMLNLFKDLPEAIHNTTAIAERCSFNLKKEVEYQTPEFGVMEHGTQSHLEKICYEAAIRKYGTLPTRVRDRLEREFALIRKHNLAKFFLTYHEIIQIAQQVMIDLGIGNPSIPLEERPPGRGRGSSVAMLICYLIGLSHIDPLKYNLSLDRFINDDTIDTLDIDIDFPRDIREKLIERVHERYGWQRAALTGAIATYKMKGSVRDLGKVLGLQPNDIDKLSKHLDTRRSKDLRTEIDLLPSLRRKTYSPLWQILIELTSELQGFPKFLMQHPSGMIITSSPLINIVPIQQGTIEGRYICQWDKNSILDAKFVKIDFLGLGVLSQMQETLMLIDKYKEIFIDLSRIDFEDQRVFQSIHRADTIGIFQIESAAQMQTIVRLKPQNLTEMAYEVAAVRPGVGVNNGVSEFIERYRQGVTWEYIHEMEALSLERTKGIILFQDQVNELAMHIADFGPKEADDLRRAFSRKNNEGLLNHYWTKFKTRALLNGVSEDAARKIFRKFSGQYMFPESHAYAFGITAYQMAWLKFHYPLEFYVAIFNQQPMGFYNLETLKEDAKRHNIYVLKPDINESEGRCTIHDLQSFRLGYLNVKGLGTTTVSDIVRARKLGGIFHSLGDAIRRTSLLREPIENLINAGAFDSLISSRRDALWETGLLYSSASSQKPLPLPVDQDMVQLRSMSTWETMLAEYRTMGIHPSGHFMSYLRERLPDGITPSHAIPELKNGITIKVAGLVIRRQHPNANATFLTLEDEFGHIPLVIWPQVFSRYRIALSKPILIAHGLISRRRGSLNIVVQHVEGISPPYQLPVSRNWM